MIKWKLLESERAAVITQQHFRPNEIATMTDYKYSSNHFSSCVNEKINNPSVAAALPALPTSSNGTRKQPPRLKKSHSECEYYDNSSHSVPNEPYNLSPAKRKRKEHNAVVFEQGQSIRSSQSAGKHSQSSSKNEVGFVDGDVMQSYDKSYDKMRYQQVCANLVLFYIL